MPLKPIFEKAPMKALHALPLRPGQVNARSDAMDALLAMCENDAMTLEGALRLSMLTTRRANETKVAAAIRERLAAQKENGAFAENNYEEEVAVARAAFALYEATVDRSILEQLVRWCGYLNQTWEECMDCGQVRQHPGDLMGLLEDLYRVTGKKAVLGLCEKLRQQGMDWSGILHTFAVQRPMARVTSWADMENGMEAEKGNEQGFYTRQYLTCHGESLADGARSATLNGLYSGNGQELSAAQIGWEKLSRFHGAVCGGITCDETVAGTSPSSGVDAAALGAWVEALCTCVEAGDSLWALDSLDVMLSNALPHALLDGKMHDLQRVNGLKSDCGDAGAYHLHTGRARALRAQSRLMRAYGAAYSHAVTVRRAGFDMNLFMDGQYTVALGATAIGMQVKHEKDHWVCQVHMKQPIRAAVRVRMPGWAQACAVQVNGAAVKDCMPGSYVTLERVWQDGDVLNVTLESRVRLVNAHHQGVCVMRGCKLLAMPCDAKGDWAMACVGEPEELSDGTVTLPVAAAEEWRKRGDIPADVPVKPKTCGETVTAALKPYAVCCGIALFPLGSKA